MSLGSAADAFTRYGTASRVRPAEILSCVRTVLSTRPHQTVPLQSESPLRKSFRATLPRPDPARVVKQAVLFFLSRQAAELLASRVVWQEEPLLAVENRRVGRIGIIEALDLAGAKRELDAAPKRRMRIGLEVGIDRIRNLAGMPLDLG
jgi:hypothetical protein